jgi:hypothetical protein
MTSFRLATVVDALHTLSGEAVRETSDATLREFKRLCDHWQKMVAAELEKRGAE